MKSFKERIKVDNNQYECKERATHKHSNGDLYVKAGEPHEFGEWLNFNHSNGFWTKSLLEAGNESILTLIKKPTPTKFVKVEEPIFDLKGEFERGELYFDVAAVSGGVFLSNYKYAKIDSKELLCDCYSEGNVYLQVEIDWRDELDSYLDSISSLDSNFDEKVTLEFSKSKFAYNMSDDEFLAACHLVASLTEKPTN